MVVRSKCESCQHRQTRSQSRLANVNNVLVFLYVPVRCSGSGTRFPFWSSALTSPGRELGPLHHHRALSRSVIPNFWLLLLRPPPWVVLGSDG